MGYQDIPSICYSDQRNVEKIFLITHGRMYRASLLTCRQILAANDAKLVGQLPRTGFDYLVSWRRNAIAATSMLFSLHQYQIPAASPTTHRISRPILILARLSQILSLPCLHRKSTLLGPLLLFDLLQTPSELFKVLGIHSTPITIKMIDLSRRRVLDTLNSRYLYGRVVRPFPQRHDCSSGLPVLQCPTPCLLRPLHCPTFAKSVPM